MTAELSPPDGLAAAASPFLIPKPGRVPMCLRTRPWTPDRRVVDETIGLGRSITLKRLCNGCGVLLGDVTDGEIQAARAGVVLPDVRSECPFCSRKPA